MTSGPLFYSKKGCLKILDEDEYLELTSKKRSNKQNYTPPWSVTVGLLEVVNVLHF